MASNEGDLRIFLKISQMWLRAQVNNELGRETELHVSVQEIWSFIYKLLFHFDK